MSKGHAQSILYIPSLSQLPKKIEKLQKSQTRATHILPFRNLHHLPHPKTAMRNKLPV
jgi:hypothetical protein